VDFLRRRQTAARWLMEAKMSDENFKTALGKAEYDPLLPIEKKLIGWSLGLGVTLLVIFAALSRFFPVA
jgi:hypothetical protein